MHILTSLSALLIKAHAPQVRTSMSQDPALTQPSNPPPLVLADVLALPNLHPGTEHANEAHEIIQFTYEDLQFFFGVCEDSPHPRPPEEFHQGFFSGGSVSLLFGWACRWPMAAPRALVRLLQCVKSVQLQGREAVSRPVLRHPG